MTDHLSELDVDTAAAKFDLAPASSAHLAACDDCRRRVEARRAAARELRADPRFVELERRLESPRAARRRRRWLLAAPVALAGVVALALALSRGSSTVLRTKGHGRLAIVDAAGRDVDHVRAGEAVGLTVRGVEGPYLLVVGVDASGSSTVLWPPDDAGSAPRPATATLPTTFQATPGDTALVALASSEPLSAAVVARALDDARVAPEASLAADLARVPTLPDETGRAWTLLHVDP